MQEHQVTIGGETFALPEPFLVLATQNPIEQEGTYPLPEAQVDRFMLKLRVTYPPKSIEREIMRRVAGGAMPPLAHVASAVDVLEARNLTQGQIDQAVGNSLTLLPTYLVRPEGWGGSTAQTVNDLTGHNENRQGNESDDAPQTPGEAFRVAELARDSLRAPRLAGQLFLDLAAADSGSIFAPKALVAALPLLPDRRDSIVGVLDGAYAASPYTRALRGEASPAYAAAEDSLAHELGVQVAHVAPPRAARTSAPSPLTGPRGPWLDDVPRRDAPPAAVRGRPRPDAPGRRVPAERPTVRPGRS